MESAKSAMLVPVEEIDRLIFCVRGQRIMLDADLARMYGVTTKHLHQQLKRNQGRFPEDFAFQLTNQPKRR